VDELCADDPHLGVTSFVDHPDASRHFRRHGNRPGDLFHPGRGRMRVTERAPPPGASRRAISTWSARLR
jgi:hypothetical protein